MTRSDVIRAALKAWAALPEHREEAVNFAITVPDGYRLDVIGPDGTTLGTIDIGGYDLYQHATYLVSDVNQVLVNRAGLPDAFALRPYN